MKSHTHFGLTKGKIIHDDVTFRLNLKIFLGLSAAQNSSVLCNVKQLHFIIPSKYMT